MQGLEDSANELPCRGRWGAGARPWPPARVIFLLSQETGGTTSGGGLGAARSLGLENILALGDRWPVTLYPQTSGPARLHIRHPHGRHSVIIPAHGRGTGLAPGQLRATAPEQTAQPGLLGDPPCQRGGGRRSSASTAVFCVRTGSGRGFQLTRVPACSVSTWSLGKARLCVCRVWLKGKEVCLWVRGGLEGKLSLFWGDSACQVCTHHSVVYCALCVFIFHFVLLLVTQQLRVASGLRCQDPVVGADSQNSGCWLRKLLRCEKATEGHTTLLLPPAQGQGPTCSG